MQPACFHQDEFNQIIDTYIADPHDNLLRAQVILWSSLAYERLIRPESPNAPTVLAPVNFTVNRYSFIPVANQSDYVQPLPYHDKLVLEKLIKTVCAYVQNTFDATIVNHHLPVWLKIRDLQNDDKIDPNKQFTITEISDGATLILKNYFNNFGIYRKES